MSPAMSLKQQQATVDWADYVQGFHQGKWAQDATPPFPHNELTLPDSPPESDLGQQGIEMRDEAQARQVWTDKGYLPAVRGPREEERRRVLQRFDLASLGQVKAIDRVADIAQAFFAVPIVVVSLVLPDRETFTSTIGWDAAERDPNFPRIAIPLDSALCPHAMTRDEAQDVFILGDSAADWRFKNNPYVRNGGPISFFASSNIYLPSVDTQGERLPVGSLCIVDRSPRLPESLTREQRETLRSLADMIAREFEMVHEKRRLANVAARTAMLGRLFRSEMVFPHRKEVGRNHSAGLSANTVEDLMKLLGGDAAAIFDLRSFHPPAAGVRTATGQGQEGSPPVHNSITAIHSDPMSPSSSNAASPTPFDLTREALDGAHQRRPSFPRQQSSSYDDNNNPRPAYDPMHRRPSFPRAQSNLTNGSSAEWYASTTSNRRGAVDGAVGTITLMGSTGADWTSRMDGAPTSIAHALVAYYGDNNSLFDETTTPSPLSDLLPPETTASISVPIFDASGEPALLLVVCSFTKYFTFEKSDPDFVADVGAVLVNSLLQKRILEADRAKLAFVSQISHELRTPLHGIGSQLELIRTVATPESLVPINPLLDVADVCISSLREILDDTLEFSKMSNSVADESSRPAQLIEVHLGDLVENVIKSCWSRTRQYAAVSERQATDSNQPHRGHVDILLDYQLPSRLRAMVDIGGLKRCLFNILGNSLKFTDTGSVTVIISEAISSSETRRVAFQVVDTGRGMTEDFLKEQLFIPFKQENSFATGAGLGVSITDRIVRRMGGTLHYASTLGVGTTASMVLPLRLLGTDSDEDSSRSSSARQDDFFSDSPTAPPPRIISDELSQLLTPLQINSERFEGPPELKRAGSDESGVTTICRSPMKTEEEGVASPDSVSTVIEPPTPSVLRVLVSDDNPIARTILSRYLKAKKIDFVECGDGLEAVKLFKSFKPSVVWIDVQMPVMDGIEASRLMRVHENEQDWPRSRIVAISGLSSELGQHSSLLASGQIDLWLVKGGPTLKTLGQDLVTYQAELELEIEAKATAAASA